MYVCGVCKEGRVLGSKNVNIRVGPIDINKNGEIVSDAEWLEFCSTNTGISAMYEAIGLVSDEYCCDSCEENFKNIEDVKNRCKWEDKK